ncbi:MAG: inorganic phosphate transporter [Mycobacteriales bacterium]
MQTAGLVVAVAVALVFEFSNGFHDTANAIATSVSTRALPPRLALALAALLNLVGALVSTSVALTVVTRIIALPGAGEGLAVIFSALLGALAWNLATWFFGLPSSSTHALIGGLVGAGMASSSHVHWISVLAKVIAPLVLSPIAGVMVGFGVMVVLMWLLRGANPHRTNRFFRGMQVLSAGAMSYSHGSQDAQKTMGVITLALIATHRMNSSHPYVPTWVVLVCAVAMSAGTYAGGWRIMRRLGRRVISLDPVRGFAAEATSAAVLLVSAYGFAAPVSSTHVITSAITGVGATRRMSAARWGVAGDIVAAWVLTLPAAGLLAALSFLLVRGLG